MKILKKIKGLIKKIKILSSYYRIFNTSIVLRKEVKFRKSLGFFFSGIKSMENGTFEEQERFIFQKLIDSFDVFVNVGANSGFYACQALNRGVPTIAFEPNKLNIEILQKNIEANNFATHFQIFPIALGNQVGLIPMYGQSTGASLIKGWAGQEDKYLVPISKLDEIYSLIRGKTGLFLVDIEGSEYDFLRGATKLLKSRNNHAFLMEISISEHQPGRIKINPNLLDIFSLLFSHDYQAYTANNNLRIVEFEELEAVVSSSVDTLETHNFLFVKDHKILEKIRN